MNLKLVILMVIFMGVANQAKAAQQFSGTSKAYGDASSNCSDIGSQLSEEEAKANADLQAENFCDTFSMAKSRVSKFTITVGGCNRAGSGISTHTEMTLTASAEYRCKQ